MSNSCDIESSRRGTLKDVGIGESMGNSGETLHAGSQHEETKRGLGFGMASFFLVAQMAGAGFLALPRAMADAGWAGCALTVVFCISVGFSGTRLSRCWVILEERWDEYKQKTRTPYMDIAYRALGNHGRRLAFACILATLIGSTIVFIILIAGMMANLLPVLSQCQWSLIVAVSVLPATWLGSPKDFWQASVLAVATTALAVLVIVVKIIVDEGGVSDVPPVHLNPSLTSFSLAYGAILFAFGGACVFPTIQNDMNNRSDFWKSVVIAFAVILTLYLPVQVVGYVYIGDAVKSNILLSLNPGIIVTIAMVMEIMNLLGTYVITFNPVAQAFEDTFDVPDNFGWKRVFLRSGIIFFELIVALAVPDFGLILNLIGGSTVALLSFVLPPLMYMKLVDDKSNKQWPIRSVPLWERTYLCIIIFAGITGGLSATVSALMGIINPESFHNSCFSSFGR